MMNRLPELLTLLSYIWVKGSVGSGGYNFKPLPRLPHQDGAREGLCLHPSPHRGTSLREKRSQPWVITVKVTMFHR